MIIMLGGRNGLIGMFTQGLGAGKLVFAYGMAGLFLGYLYFSIPRVVTTVMAAAKKIDPMYEEAARTLGASSFRILKDVTLPALAPALFSTGALCFATSMGATPIQVFFKITIPLARPGIMAGALLAFLYSFDEVALSSLLSTPRFITLPIRIMNYMELTFDPTLAAISTLLILASLVLIVLMEKFVGLDMFVK